MGDQTPSQTVGPFFEYALPYEGGPERVAPDDPDAVRIAGAVYDGAGDPVDDALVELWQASRAGRYRHPEDDRDDLPLEPGFTGFGRCPTDAEGRYSFLVPAGAGAFEVMVFARGLLKGALTRLYLDGPAEDETMIAVRSGDGYRFDVHLQGDAATAFFDL
jgi:protocatechuate 3,4-dioxygenase, alpha subunit